ncbi:MAG: hypothetical protein ACJAWV_003894, partial [Flammeovirgaceae bacterium]
YNFKSKELHIEGVEFVAVSNAHIIPSEGKLKMKEGASLDTLKNAKVLFADGNEAHSFSTGDILIQSKDKFDGIGNYEFETYNSKKLMLQFTNFRQSSRQVAHGSGSKQITENIGESFIPADKSVEIMPGILYTGKVFLSDYKKEFDLDGLIALNVEGDEKHWIKYNTVNDAKISIAHKMVASNSGKHLHTGIFLEGSERELYSSFVAPSTKDGIPVFVAEGELDYNSESKSYELSKVKKHNFGVSKEQKFHYHHDLKEIDFEGVVNLGDATRYFAQRSAAVGTINSKTGELEMNTLLVLDIKAPKKIFEHMIFTLDEYKLNHGAKPTNKKLFASQLYHVASNEELNFIADQKPIDVKLNELFDNSVTITNLELHWSDKQHAFYSKGKLGLANFFNMNVDAELKGFVYLPKRQNNHEMHFYFEVGDDWYYMKRDGDLLSFRSSREDFNKILSGKSGRYTLISETEANIVIDRHKRADY